MLDHITPVLLTHNEEQNIGRTLSLLKWAKDVVVVDSGSTDGTLTILAAFPNVRVFKRRFDTHAKQWRYAVEETQIATEWILRLDADYQVSDALVSELAQLDPNAPVNAYRIEFDYAIFSRKIPASLYPANTILLRNGKFSVWDRGHTEAWDVKGPIATLSGRVTHDDWKPTAQWLSRPSALHATRVGVASRRQRRAGALAAPQTAAHADCRLYLLSIWKGAHCRWAGGNVLRAPAYGRRGCAFPHGVGSKAA